MLCRSLLLWRPQLHPPSPSSLQAATSAPLIERSIERATGIVYNITGGKDLTLQEVNRVSEVVTSLADPSANVIFGAVIDDQVGRVVVLGGPVRGGAALLALPPCLARRVSARWSAVGCQLVQRGALRPCQARQVFIPSRVLPPPFFTARSTRARSTSPSSPPASPRPLRTTCGAPSRQR